MDSMLHLQIHLLRKLLRCDSPIYAEERERAISLVSLFTAASLFGNGLSDYELRKAHDSLSDLLRSFSEKSK